MRSRYDGEQCVAHAYYKVETELPMIRWAPLVRASVLSGEGVEEAMELVVEAGRWRRERLPKGPLNDVFQVSLLHSLHLPHLLLLPHSPL